MNSNSTYYDLLEVAPHADLAEITGAYLRISRELEAGRRPLPPEGLAFQQQVLKHAFDVLSSPSRRSDYDAGLVARGSPLSTLPLQVEVALEPGRASPIRRLLTVIAAVMVIGLVMQVTVTFMAYQRSKNLMGGEVSGEAAEKVYLQEIYQTYGIRAANRAEAELLLADRHRQEQEARAAEQQQRQQEEEERRLKRFEEESRRLGAEVTAANLQAEQAAERQREEEARKKEQEENAVKEAERRRREMEIARFRGRTVSGDE